MNPTIIDSINPTGNGHWTPQNGPETYTLQLVYEPTIWSALTPPAMDIGPHKMNLKHLFYD
jgi:hypothetical protein